MTATAEASSKTDHSWMDDIDPMDFWINAEWWAHEIWGTHWWEKQRDIAASVRRHRHTAAATCNSFGKTEIAVELMILYIISHFPSNGILMSASWKVGEETLWARARQKIQQLRQVFPCFEEENTEEWRPYGPQVNCAMILMSPKDKETVGGRHNENVFVIMDEASGFDLEIFMGAMSVTTRENDRMLMLGNPFQPSGPFYDAFTVLRATSEDDQSGWHCMNVSMEDTPNVKLGRVVVPNIVSPQGYEDFKRTYTDPSEYLPRIYGQFPDKTDMTIISQSAIRDASKVVPKNDDDERIYIGVDISWGGSDKTVFTVCTAHRLIEMDEFGGLKEPEIIRKIKDYDKDWTRPAGKPEIYVDATGNPSVVHMLEDEGMPNVYGVVSSRAASDDARFVNVRAEMYWGLKMALSNGFHIPEKYVRVLASQAGIQMKRVTGRIQVELKDQIKLRIGRSPDNLDSLAIRFAKKLGESVFEIAEQQYHRIRVPVEVVRGAEGWNIRFKDQPPGMEATRPGHLMRGMWVSLSGESCAVWCHRDKWGNWSVFDHLRMRATFREFMREVVRKSEDHTYEIDAWSMNDTSSQAVLSLHSELEPYFRHVEFPSYIDPEPILNGQSGINTLESLFLGTLAYYPEHPHWRGNKELAEEFKGRGMLFVRPDGVLEEIREVRTKNVTWRNENGAKDELVDGGGSAVKALRLVAMVHAGMEV